MRSQCRPRTRPVLCLRLAPHNLSTRRTLTDLYFATQAGNPNWVAPGCPLTARSGGGGILRSLPSLCFSTGPERPWSFQRSRGSRQTHLQPYVPRLGRAAGGGLPGAAEGAWGRGRGADRALAVSQAVGASGPHYGGGKGSFLSVGNARGGPRDTVSAR